MDTKLLFSLASKIKFQLSQEAVVPGKNSRDDWKMPAGLESLAGDEIRPGGTVCSGHNHSRDSLLPFSIPLSPAWVATALAKVAGQPLRGINPFSAGWRQSGPWPLGQKLLRGTAINNLEGAGCGAVSLQPREVGRLPQWSRPYLGCLARWGGRGRLGSDPGEAGGGREKGKGEVGREGSGRGGPAVLGGALLSAAAEGMGGPTGPPRLLLAPRSLLCLLCLLPPLLKVSAGSEGLFSGWGRRELELRVLLTARP